VVTRTVVIEDEDLETLSVSIGVYPFSCQEVMRGASVGIAPVLM
jgi:hypothetical protein